MDLYLYEYNKDKIKQMLKKVEPYQKAAGYYKLKEYKNLEDVIFNMKDKDAGMYATYFEAIKNTQNYLKISLSNKNNLFYLDFKVRQLPFIADILSIQNIKKVVLYSAKSYLKDYQIFIGDTKDSKSNDLMLKLVRYFHIKPVNMEFFISYKNADEDALLKVGPKLYITKRNEVGLRGFYKRGRSSYTLISTYSKDFFV